MVLSFDEANRVLRINFDGIVTDDVLLDHYDEARRWISVHGYAAQLTDFSSVTSFEVTSEGVRKLARKPPLAPDPFLRVVVAPQEIMYGMARMFEGVANETRSSIHVVRSREDALKVLGIATPNFQPAE